MESILDAGFLYALVDESDEHNFAVTKAMQNYRGRIILPVPAITEVAYLVKKYCGVIALAEFLESLVTVEYEFETPTAEDYKRAAEVLRKYNDANSDFVDACIVAIAERLNVTKILTVDRRHFGIFKPRHCAAFEILP